MVAGVAVFTLRPWWWTLTLGTALASLVVTVLGLPHSAGGVVLNVLILAYLILGRRYSFLPSREDSEDTSSWPWGE